MNEKKQALKKWFKEVTEEMQNESFGFKDSMVPFGVGMAMGILMKHYKELEDIIDDN